jgi:1-acyl-sn-glycerol-3-phosphate acyltransferase
VPPPTEPGVPTPSPLYRLVAGSVFKLMRLQRWRLEVRGLQHLPRRDGAVLVANHTSFLDFFASGSGAYLHLGRPVRILAKASLFDTPVFGWLMQQAGHIPVHRAAGSRALTSAIAALQRGEMVLVLPEQTISPAFELRAFKRGAARMAAMAGVPMVPVVTWGSHRAHTVGRPPRPRWRLPVSIRYGEPVWPAPHDDPAAVMEELRRHMRVLLDQEQRAYPDGAPPGAWWVPARLGGGAPDPDEAEAYVAGLEAGWRRAAAARIEQAREQLRHEADVTRQLLEDGRDRVQQRADLARDRVADHAEQARGRVAERSGQARGRAEHVRERLVERTEHLLERVAGPAPEGEDAHDRRGERAWNQGRLGDERAPGSDERRSDAAEGGAGPSPGAEPDASAETGTEPASPRAATDGNADRA